jgi:hypothetical protein
MNKAGPTLDNVLCLHMFTHTQGDTKRVNSRAGAASIAGLHRPLNSTVLPYSERREKELCATALAGVAAPRIREIEYGNTMGMPFQAA